MSTTQTAKVSKILNAYERGPAQSWQKVSKTNITKHNGWICFAKKNIIAVSKALLAEGF